MENLRLSRGSQHVLSFQAVTAHQQQRGVNLVCTRCRAEFKTQQEWLDAPECPWCIPPAVHVWHHMLHCACGQKGWGR